MCFGLNVSVRLYTGRSRSHLNFHYIHAVVPICVYFHFFFSCFLPMSPFRLTFMCTLSSNSHRFAHTHTPHEYVFAVQIRTNVAALVYCRLLSFVLSVCVRVLSFNCCFACPSYNRRRKRKKILIFFIV